MNYPIAVKKVISGVRIQMHDAWQNLRELKRHIACLVRSIDAITAQVHRSRRLVQGIAIAEKDLYPDEGFSTARETKPAFPHGGFS